MASSRRRMETPTLSWRERFRAMRNLPPFLRMVWETHRGYTTGILALRLLRALVPVTSLWVGKLIVDGIVEATRAGAVDWRELGSLVALEFAIVATGEVAARSGALLESLLGDLFSNRLSVRLMEHAATLDLRHFEDPVFYDRLERARRQTVGRIALVGSLLGLAQDALTLLTLVGTLLAFSPLLFLLLVVTVLPAFLGETHYASLGYSLLYQWTPERRKLDYYRYLAATESTAKEVKLFGLSRFLTDEYARLADEFYRANRRLAIRRNLAGTGLSLLSALGYYSAYAAIVYRTVRGALSLGDLTLLAGTFSRSRDLVQRMLLTTADLAEQALYLDDLFAFFSMRPEIHAPAHPLPVPRPIRTGFEFRDVWFRYDDRVTGDGLQVTGEPPVTRDLSPVTPGGGEGSGGDGWVLRGVSFRIAPGERWALVGENGAGKTTLIKLLLRLYLPTRGEILLDGRPLSDYDPAEYHREVGVIFQDFVRYDMRAEENIAVGRIDALAEAQGRIESAAERSLAAGVIDALPQRYRTMLGRRFEGGVDLSGGQWQKVALARAYLRDAQVLILDEPTAALDARAEYEVFHRFADLTRGKIAILISHRFSTVRMADRILVLEHGEVLEEGSHEELVARGGRYAELFSLQAAGYR